MKKSVVIKGLVVGALGLFCVYGTVGFAQENNSVEDIPEQKLKSTEGIEPTALTVIAEKKEIEEGQPQQLTAVFTPENSTATVTWTSSDEAVATVSEIGVVTALKAGTVTITAKTENGLSGEVVLTINAKVKGIFGTVPWEWEAQSQTLTFGGGDLPNTNPSSNIESNSSSNIRSNIESLSTLEGAKIHCIKFTESVQASPNSSEMFAGLVSLETIEGAAFLDTSYVESMKGMFGYTPKLTDVDVSNWDTSSVRDMSFMFSDASSLTRLDVGNWNTSKVTDMLCLFRFASKLTDIDVSNWDTTNVTDMSKMFYYASSLTELDVSDWNTRSVTSMYSMFSDASSLTRLDVSGWDTRNVTVLDTMFLHASSLTELDVSGWDTGNVTYMGGMFADTSSLKRLDVSGWNTRNVTNMNSVFSDASSLTELDVSGWDTRNVTNMDGMFSGTSKLTDVDISNWNTSKVINTAYMFSQAVNLTKLDLSNWNTTKVTNMTNMFAYASKLYELNLSNWDTGNVTSSENIFYRADSLDVLTLGPNFKAVSSTNLPKKKVDLYTGRWLLDSSEAENSYESSSSFMTKYDGTKPGKYIREIKTGIKVTGIELMPAALNLTISEESQIQAKVLPENATNKKVTYSVTDPAIASVSKEGLVTGLKAGTTEITALTEDGGFKATMTVNVSANSSLILDPFYLGLDDFITGEIDAALSAKNVQLWVNDQLISTAEIASDRSFELDTEGTITKATDKVKIIILDSKNEEINYGIVKIKEIIYKLLVSDFELSKDSAVIGKTDYFQTHVALVINGKEIERKLLTSNRQFTFDVESLIKQESDKVEIVGYRYSIEVTRQKVNIKPAKAEMTLNIYKLDTPYVTGKVTGKSAKSVRLYVNRRRQETVKIAEDGTFNLLGVGILSITDKVEIAVLNGQGVEMLRSPVSISQ